MFGGVLDGEGLNAGVSIQERTHLRRNFREDSVVVVIDVGTILPKRSAGELSRVGIKSFDVVHETWLRLNLRQKRVVQHGAKFGDLGWCDGASDNASDHELPPLASKSGRAVGDGARGRGQKTVPPRECQVKSTFSLSENKKAPQGTLTHSNAGGMVRCSTPLDIPLCRAELGAG